MVELAVALVVTAVLSPVVRVAMLRRGVLDVPNHRSSHSVPVVRGGGLACLGGCLAAAGAALLLGHAVPWLALSASAGLALVGFADDRHTLPAAPRLVIQAVVGATVGSAAGWLAAGLGAIVMVLLVNVVNFMDGINAITSVSMGIWGAVCLVLGCQHHAWQVVVLGAMAAGSALGFLPWNAPTARLFLGDSGSYLFGALVASTILVARTTPVPLPVLVAPLAVYVTDVVSTLLRRAIRGAKLTEAHRDHTYQRLTTGVAGGSHLTVAGTVGTCSLVITLVTAWLPPLIAGTCWVVILGAYLAAPHLYRGAPTTTSRGA